MWRSHVLPRSTLWKYSIVCIDTCNFTTATGSNSICNLRKSTKSNFQSIKIEYQSHKRTNILCFPVLRGAHADFSAVWCTFSDRYHESLQRYQSGGWHRQAPFPNDSDCITAKEEIRSCTTAVPHPNILFFRLLLQQYDS